MLFYYFSSFGALVPFYFFISFTFSFFTFFSLFFLKPVACKIDKRDTWCLNHHHEEKLRQVN